jgi:aspartate racemase
MKTLGLIGGTSWHSTIEYYRYINEMVSKLFDPPENPPLLIYSLNVDLMRRGDWEEIKQAYLDISLNLQRAGAEAIVICANTPHKVIPFVAPQIDIPFIHIADATGEEAKSLGLKNLGLLGTKPVMEEDFISGQLTKEYHIQTIIPDRRKRVQMHRIIANELTQGIFQESTKQFVLSEMQNLKTEGADGIILGCTELPMLIKPKDFDLPLLDTTYLHAKKAVDFIVC